MRTITTHLAPVHAATLADALERRIGRALALEAEYEQRHQRGEPGALAALEHIHAALEAMQPAQHRARVAARSPRNHPGEPQRLTLEHDELTEALNALDSIAPLEHGNEQRARAARAAALELASNAEPQGETR